MRDQAQLYGTRIEDEYVTKIERCEDGLFTADYGSGSVKARDRPARHRRVQSPAADRRGFA